ncbi:MAG: acyl-CoA desaturase [Salibacteraceae bacterium]
MRKRVNEYFEKKNVKRTGDYRVAIKAVVMFSMFFIPYAIIISNQLDVWQYFLASFVMGIGMAGIGLAVMHDANHGALSSKQWVNDIMAYSLNVIGGNSLSWKIQHNVLHHSFTNVHGVDEDLEGGHIMRFTPNEPWKKHHKLQHIYAWMLYSLMTFSWVLIKDFKRISNYHKLGLVEAQGTTFTKAILTVFVSKVVYISYMLVLPLYLGYNVWLVLGGFVLMHLLGGLILAMIFQPAHIMDHHTFIEGDREVIEDTYESHQLKTTSNFAPSNKWLTWYCGGLNYQVEHHIFPSVSHIHYPDISRIVKETAEEFGLPYRSVDTWAKALGIHQRTMRKLGQPDWAL